MIRNLRGRVTEVSGEFLNTIVGEYRLVDFLGAGGMGEVYRAVHNKIGRVAALKVLTYGRHEAKLIKRFFNEARIQASIHHPNIATLYDFLEVNGRPCIVMEYIDGQTLADHISTRGPLPLAETICTFQAIVGAVDYIHSYGIVHRDIKTNNVKVSSTGQVKLLDFGIALSEATRGLTVTGEVVGTLKCISPEQLCGKTVDAQSDIWALGVLLYEMATGHPPFEAETISELFDKVSKVIYTPPSARNSTIPRKAEAIIARCLQRDPARRYQSAKELLEDTLRLSQALSTPCADDVKKSKKALGGGLISTKSVRLVLSAVLSLTLIIGLVTYLAVSRMTDPATADEARPQKAAAQPSHSLGGGESGALLRSIQIDVFEGEAEVYRGAQLLGSTPYEVKAFTGENIDLTLKCNGFIDKRVQFSVTGSRKVYTFKMERD